MRGFWGMSVVLRALFLCATSSALLVSVSRSVAMAQSDDGFDDDFGEDEDLDAAPRTRAPAGAPAPQPAPVDDEEPPPFDASEASESASEPETQAQPEDVREEHFRAHNSWGGPVGGIHIVDAGSASKGSFRVQLATEFFVMNGFLFDDDHNQHVSGVLSVSATILDYLEIFGAVVNSANRNDKDNPKLFQVLGDTYLGAKGFYSVLPWLTVGGDVTFAFLNSVGDIGLSFRGTSVGLRGNAAADFRHFTTRFPLIARFNFQYMFDNSAKLIEDVEKERYNRLPPDVRASTPDQEYRHLLTRVERFALGINRTDFINIGLGFEAPLEVLKGLYVNPILEWALGIPINRQGYSCLFVPAAGTMGELASGQDGCLDRQGFKSFPQTITVGVRVLPPVKGLATFVAADVGITGKSTFVRELAPNAPYNVLLGISYAYEPGQRTVVSAPPRAPAAAPPLSPLRGKIKGVVIEQGSGAPIAGAVVQFPGRNLTALSAGDDGKFVTYELDPGTVNMDVNHPDYTAAACSSTIPNQRPSAGELVVETRCELVPLPKLGNVYGRVKTPDGGAVVAARVIFSGASDRQTTTDATGQFRADQILAGTYTVKVEADGYFPQIQSITLSSKQTLEPQFEVIPRPRKALVQVRRREITIKRQIQFAIGSSEILGESTALMMEIADVLISHPEVKLVEIQGHTDDRGSQAVNLGLSQSRADAVRQWLVDHGVESARLEAKGYGDTKPLVPNITGGNRARNRRVQFIIREQPKTEEVPATAAPPADTQAAPESAPAAAPTP